MNAGATDRHHLLRTSLVLNDGRLLLAGGRLPCTDARQGDLDNPGVLIVPAGLLAQADQPTGNGLVYPKVRQWSVSQQSTSLSSAVPVRKCAHFRRVSCVLRFKPITTGTFSAAQLSERWSIHHRKTAHIIAPAVAAPATRCSLWRLCRVSLH